MQESQQPESQLRANELAVTTDEEGMRVDRYLRHHFAIGFAECQRLVRAGQVRVNGKRKGAGGLLAVDDQVRVPPSMMEKARFARALPSQPPTKRQPSAAKSSSQPSVARSSPPSPLVLCQQLELARTPLCVAINKPSGLAVQGGSGLASSIDALLPLWPDTDGELRLVHRLDRATSGVMVVACGRKAAATLSTWFRGQSDSERAAAVEEGIASPEAAMQMIAHRGKERVEKTYLALVHGVPSQLSDHLEMPLNIERISPHLRRAYVDKKEGKPASSHYTVMAEGTKAEKPYALLRVMPYTGRLHQIRAHLEAIGHPIVGDPIYDGSDPNYLPQPKSRHAKRRLRAPNQRAEKASYRPQPSAPPIRREEHRLGLHAWRLRLPNGSEFEADPDAQLVAMLGRHAITWPPQEWSPHFS
ncbi:MAG: RluA family pseudouridine synthase [Alphaproteobacteria bacterium]|nr:RluA family pseudouridine synthase [Alphaproteobacteria bacterium]